MSNLSKELVEMQILLRKYKVPQRSIDKIINRERNMQDRINKAIEYIYENAYDTERKNVIDDLFNEIPELINILKGSEE